MSQAPSSPRRNVPPSTLATTANRAWSVPHEPLPSTLPRFANHIQISYLSSSQGFLWNPEVFIPSYMDYEYTPLEHQREPVIEIVLSDEEIKKMLPQ